MIRTNFVCFVYFWLIWGAAISWRYTVATLANDKLYFFFFLFFSPANLWCSQNFVWKSQFEKFWLEFDRTIWRTKEFYRYNTPEEFFDGRWINRVNLNFLHLPNLLFETVLSKKFRAFSIFCSHISIICSHWTIYSNESLTNRSSVNDEKK